MRKFVRHTKHPEKDLTLSCYTKAAFYKKKWDAETINARGHVHDSHGNLVSCPFKKIFNLDEHPSTERSHVIDLLDAHWHEVIEYKKWNGHLCIMFHDGTEWVNSTKGSFDHDFIALDRLVIESSGYTDKVLDQIPTEWTMMFEIIADYDTHALTDIHMDEIGGEHAVLIGVNDRTTEKTVKDYRSKILRVFHDLEESPPFIPLGMVVSDGIFIDDLDDEERKEAIAEYLGLVMERQDTEGSIFFIPSIDYRVKLKNPWFLKKRYIKQFNSDMTKKIFTKYEDCEEAFNKIPEELHPHYEEVINDYFTFIGLYNERLMEAYESVCKGYKTRPEIFSYIDTCPELDDLERKTMKAYLTNVNLHGCMKDVFMVKYRSFSLVDRIS